MCGIFGIARWDAPATLALSTRRVTTALFDLSEARGKDASGIAVAQGDSIRVLRRDLRGGALARLAETRALLEHSSDSLPLCLIGHTRMVTNGAACNVGNNQPVARDGSVSVHNGIITNDLSLWRSHPSVKRLHEVDTEVFAALIGSELGRGADPARAFRDVMRKLQGANTIATLFDSCDAILAATTNGSLFVTCAPTAGIAVFASERQFIDALVQRFFRTICEPTPVIRQIAPGHGMILDPVRKEIREFSLLDDSTEPALHSCRRGIIDVGSSAQPVAQALPIANGARLLELERAMQIDDASIEGLRRCTRCVLPETFPFIRFDSEGVCNVCRTQQPIRLQGVDALRMSLGQNKSRCVSCLAPISGGRDSCFGLHYMVHELGLRPVTYTYDWGMVTPLARRNISRMCGALGLEHILVSADITRKRQFIRMNVAAWLRRPRLGTIPLFMAGDKHFFFHAERLKRQMRLDTILFSMNPLERTDFKVGFCGIDENYGKTKHYDPTNWNKARLAMYFAKEFLQNPAYINPSLLDSLKGYLAYYVLPKGYVTLFDYIPWKETVVERTLIDQYAWETAPDTRSTWRIGDGTAAFYNHVYLSVAGFSEHDTFRSNQIRNGLIDRASAIALIREENRPRVTACAEYFDLIGLDAVEAMKVVRNMRKFRP